MREGNLSRPGSYQMKNKSVKELLSEQDNNDKKINRITVCLSKRDSSRFVGKRICTLLVMLAVGGPMHIFGPL